MIKKTLLQLITIIAVSVLSALALVKCENYLSRGERGHERLRDTLYVESPPVHDTVVITKVEPAGIVTARLPVVADVPQPPLQEGDSLCNAQERRDSADVLVPLTKTTVEGDNYVATVTGFHASVDDIIIRRPPTMVVTTAAKESRVGIDMTIGPQLGYGFTPDGWRPYAGVGVTLGIKLRLR